MWVRYVLFSFFFLSIFVLPLEASVGISKATCVSLKGCGNAAIYMTLNLPKEDVLEKVDVSSEIAHHAELHTHTDVGGVMQMRAISSMFVSNGTLVLEKGGLHIMLIGLQRELEPGEKVPLTLYFKHAGKVELRVPTEKGGWKTQREPSAGKKCCCE